MRKRWIAMIGLLCVACGDSNDTPQKGSNGGEDSGAPGNVGAGPESCTAIVAQYGASCDSAGYTMVDCEDIRLLYVGEGCGDAWSKYASCAAAAKPDCEEGDFPDCRKDFGGLFQCQSAFAARTGCTRLSGGDSSCPAEAPYALGCLDEPPSKACVITEDDTLCCP